MAPPLAPFASLFFFDSIIPPTTDLAIQKLIWSIWLTGITMPVNGRQPRFCTSSRHWCIASNADSECTCWCTNCTIRPNGPAGSRNRIRSIYSSTIVPIWIRITQSIKISTRITYKRIRTCSATWPVWPFPPSPDNTSCNISRSEQDSSAVYTQYDCNLSSLRHPIQVDSL